MISRPAELLKRPCGSLIIVQIHCLSGTWFSLLVDWLPLLPLEIDFDTA